MDLARRLEQPMPVSSEAAYDRLTCYGFARRYVGGKIVADINWGDVGYGMHLLAETAESVVGLIDLPEQTADLASAVYSAPNASYRRVDLTKLPYSEGFFDVVVAFGVVENLTHPEDLVREIKRVLKQDGVLVISALDKQTQLEGGAHGGSDGLQREMYIPEFRELLERHFGLVHVYRLGAVAGGCVFPVSDKVATAPVKSARFSLTNPDLGAEPPRTRCVIAVCTDAEEPQQEEEAYLLLDRDRRVFDECEERAEDVELMQSEIRQMQETEVQAFLDALRVQQSLYYILKRYPIHLRNIIHAIRTESRMYRRVTTPYRWLRAKSRSSD